MKLFKFSIVVVCALAGYGLYKIVPDKPTFENVQVKSEPVSSEGFVKDTFIISDHGKLYSVPGYRSSLCGNPSFNLKDAIPYKGEIFISKQKGLIYCSK